MDAINYRLETFEGPLDLLLSLIQKNKMSIDDIQINVICEQYMEYIEAAQSLDMELASEFIVMASELMLIKSKLLLPKPEAEEEDPRAALADALLKFQQAKEAAKKMSLLYPVYSGRLEKDTDEISIDKTFVLDQEVESLCLAVRRIVTFNENRPKAERSVFTPMISSPIVPVEVKITGILNKMSKKKATSLKELLDESVSLPDMIAIFLGVLELIKIRKILIYDTEGTLLGDDAKFVINDNPDDVEKDANGNELYSSDFDRGAEQIEMNLDNESKGDGE
jgi:segregation and condensation protein A